MNAIEIKNLTVAYGENIALEDLNLNIEVGSLMDQMVQVNQLL